MFILRLFRRPAYLAVLLSQAWLAGCADTPIEDAVTARLHELAAAIENRDAGDVMDVLHEGFRTSESGTSMNRDEAHRRLMLVFYRHREISVMLSNIEVLPDQMNQDRAQANFNALVTGGSGGILPDDAQLYRVQSEWRFDGEWELLALHARRALEP